MNVGPSLAKPCRVGIAHREISDGLIKPADAAQCLAAGAASAAANTAAVKDAATRAPAAAVASSRRRSALGLAVVLLIALAARLPYLTTRSIWFDEAASWQTARLSVAQLFQALRVDTTMPPYYLVLKAWLTVFGDSPVSLRLSSIVFGIVTVAGMYLFAIELFLVSGCVRRSTGRIDGLTRESDSPGHRLDSAPATARIGRRRAAHGFALAVALLVALSPFQVNASIEARMYALGTAVTALSGWALLRALRRGLAWGPWLIYGALAGFALYIHPFVLFSVAAQFVFLCGMIAVSFYSGLSRRGSRLLRRTIMMGGLVVLLFSPALPLLKIQHGVVHKGFWISPLNQQMVASTLAQFVAPTYVDYRFEPYPEALALGALLAVAVALVAHGGRRGDWLVLSSALLPLALAALASLNTPIWEGRYFRFAHLYFIALAVLAIWSAFGWSKPLRRLAFGAMVAAALGANVAFWQLREIPDRPGMRGAAARIMAARRPGELVVVENHLHFLPARYYLPRDVPVRLIEPGVRVGWARSFIDSADLISDAELARELPCGIWYIAGSKLAREPAGELKSLAPAVVTESFIEHYDHGVPDWPIYVSHVPSSAVVRSVTEIDRANFAELDDADLIRFGRMAGLRTLRLDGTGVSDHGLAAVARLSLLRELSLRDTHVTDAGLRDLPALPSLESLYLDGDRVSAKGMRELRRLPRLNRLGLAGAFISDAAMPMIADVPGLEELNLDGTLVGDAGLAALAKLPQLTRVSIRGTKVTEAGVERLRELNPRVVVESGAVRVRNGKHSSERGMTLP